MCISDYSGHWSTASTLVKAVLQPCLGVIELVPQLLEEPGSTWISSSTACASSVERRQGTPRSVSNADSILVFLLCILGLLPAAATGHSVELGLGGVHGVLPDVA